MSDETLATEQKLKERKLEVEIEKIEVEVDVAKLNRTDIQEQHALYRAQGSQHRTTTFYGVVNASAALDVIQLLGGWARHDENIPPEDRTPWNINVCSPGGSVIDGLAVVDYIRDLQAQGFVINTHGIGMVASMGSVMLQAGNERTISPNAFMLIHEVSDMAMGTLGQLEDSVNFSKTLNERLRSILEERSTVPKATFTKKWKRADWWLSAEEVVKHGFADRITQTPAYVR